MSAGHCEHASLVAAAGWVETSRVQRARREGVLSLLFEILIGAIVLAAVTNLLIGLLPRRDKVAPTDMEKR